MRLNNSKKNLVKVMILVVALIVLTVSGTYAYFTTKFTGAPSTTKVTSGIFKVESSLESVSAINNIKLRLIDYEERATKAEKLTFTVTSPLDSTVAGEYFVYLKDIELSKNLYSSYFKWELLQDGTMVANGSFDEAVRKNTADPLEEDNVLTEANDIQLNTTAILLPKHETQTLEFRLWLENSTTEDQIDLINGSFSGRIYLEAIPVSENK